MQLVLSIINEILKWFLHIRWERKLKRLQDDNAIGQEVEIVYDMNR